METACIENVVETVHELAVVAVVAGVAVHRCAAEIAVDTGTEIELESESELEADSDKTSGDWNVESAGDTGYAAEAHREALNYNHRLGSFYHRSERKYWYWYALSNTRCFGTEVAMINENIVATVGNRKHQKVHPSCLSLYRYQNQNSHRDSYLPCSLGENSYNVHCL